MEVVLIGTLANAGLIVVSSLVSLGINKWNRSKLKKQFGQIVERLEQHSRDINEIRSNTSTSPVPNAPFEEVQTPSECRYVKPSAAVAKNHYMR